jgi:hypothetical protein
MIIICYHYMLYIIINKLVRIYAFMHLSNFLNLFNNKRLFTDIPH